MDLIGAKVRHIAWGDGTIKGCDGQYLAVEFSIGRKHFLYPEAFEKFLTAEDPDLQSALIKEVHQKRAAVEQARLETQQQQIATAFTTSNAKKARSIDEMFAPDYHAEKLARHPILTYQQVEEQFGIRISGFGRGINPTSSTVVLISSIRKADDFFVYHDRWTEDGDYIYSGEGRTGDQTMTKGNLAIRDAACTGKEIHLFVKFSPQEYYYQGIFELVDYTYEDENDENGNLRKEYKFQLRKVNDE